MANAGRVQTFKVADNTWSVKFRGKELHDFPSEAEALRAAADELMAQVAFAYYLLERTQAELEESNRAHEILENHAEVLGGDIAMLTKALDHAAEKLGLGSKEELLKAAARSTG